MHLFSIVINFYYTRTFIQTKSSYLHIFFGFDPLKRDKPGWQVMEIGCLSLMEIMVTFAQIDPKKCLQHVSKHLVMFICNILYFVNIFRKMQ